MDVKEFETLLDECLANKRNQMKEQYKRVVPTGELLFNRFDKAEYLGHDKTTTIYDSTIIMGDVDIGKNCWIGPNSLIEGIHEQIVIGDWVSIGTGVQIFSHDSSLNTLTGGIMPFTSGKVIIGSNVQISGMSMILCGVTIGNHCVVDSYTKVTKSFPNNSIISGSPARVIGEVVINEDGTARYKYNRPIRNAKTPENSQKSGGGGALNSLLTHRMCA